MRTTPTLDDDVAAKIQEETLRTGKKFKETINSLLRSGLHAKKPEKKCFIVRAKALGYKENLDYNCVSVLLEKMEEV